MTPVPIYAYRCERCGAATEVLWRGFDPPETIACAECASRETRRVIGASAYHASTRSKLERLDPKYDRMVDRALASTPEADVNRHLRRMKPFSGDD